MARSTKPAPRSRKLKKRFRPLHWLRGLVILFFVITITMVFLFRYVPAPITPLMVILYLDKSETHGKKNLHNKWEPLEKISPHLIEAVIASEDQLFLQHYGFDWDAIKSAFTINNQGHKKIGASTISQQTAKNLFLWPERSWTRKALEAYFTVLIEVCWNKHRIIEMYLNIIEMGDGFYGAESAAQHYFGIPASKLSISQSALLAAILPNPRVWSPINPAPYVLRRQNWIIRQMDQLGPLPKELTNELGL